MGGTSGGGVGLPVWVAEQGKDFPCWGRGGNGTSCFGSGLGVGLPVCISLRGGTSCLGSGLGVGLPVYFFKGRDFLFGEWVGGGTSCLYLFKGRDFLFWERVGGRTSWLLGDRLTFGMGVVMGLPVLGVGWRWDFLSVFLLREGLPVMGRCGDGTSCLSFCQMRDFLCWKWGEGGTSCFCWPGGWDFLFSCGGNRKAVGLAAFPRIVTSCPTWVGLPVSAGSAEGAAVGGGGGAAAADGGGEGGGGGRGHISWDPFPGGGGRGGGTIFVRETFLCTHFRGKHFRGEPCSRGTSFLGGPTCGTLTSGGTNFLL